MLKGDGVIVPKVCMIFKDERNVSVLQKVCLCGRFFSEEKKFKKGGR